MTLEELQAQVLKMNEELEQIKNENVQLKETVQEKEKREKELQEHNQKLFLKITNNVTDNTKEEEQEDIPLCLDKDTYNLLNKREKELLNILIEEEEE